MIETKSVMVSGVPATVCGDVSDLYFASLGDSIFETAVGVVANLSRPDAVVLDVGASIGVVGSAVASLVPDGEVICFEPEPRARECLVATLEGLDNARVVAKAVGAARERLRFHQDPNGTAWGMLSDREPSIDVEVTTIDLEVAALSLDRVDVIKVDVEGFELAVLDGAEGVIADHRPTLIVELNPYCLWRHGRTLPQDLIDRLLGLYPLVHAVGPDGDVVDLRAERAIDDTLYRLGTTGGLADLVATDDGIAELVDFSDVLWATADRGTADTADGDPDEYLEPASDAQPPEWNPRADIARLRSAVRWRVRSALDRRRRR